MRPIRIASRPSKLALIQANHVRTLLENLSSVEISIVECSTKGDRNSTDFLYKSGSKSAGGHLAVGFFTSEVEKALLDGRADAAVHSFKDLPTAGAEGLLVAAVPQRQSAADALVARGTVNSIADLPAGATVGTSSLRRIAQLCRLRDDLKCVPLRGNVETRVNKVESGQIDAAICACAGLNRLGLPEKISAILPPRQFLPAPAQGALAVQIRSDDSELAGLVSQLDDKHSRITAETERYVLASLHGGCSIPLGVYCEICGDAVTIDAMLSDLEGKRYIKRSKTAPIDQAKMCAEKLARELLTNGGQEILDQIRLR